MKKILLILSLFFLASCSSTQFVDSWKNEEMPAFKPQKMLVLGITQNLTARKIFEEHLKKEFLKRNINTYEGSTVIDASFTGSEKSEQEINEMISGLSKKGFDAIVLTAVKGVQEERNYDPGYYTVGYRWTRFGRYYYRYQDIYYNPAYYNEYKVYHVETSIYTLEQDDDKSLVWVGAFNIVNPENISNSVKDYVQAIIKKLETDGVISKAL
ncbi:hypothetical protein L1I30_05570 [Gillisia sp. M10.2A]|uniref:DUF4136 domain-containing protein n=1 Tax=Gillisia lutea TaxID=2909668 RepID=A0ABS9EE27_9FLAO|nr:hypothetical protein [Gillisia lutea]MCF4101125.1 hypothetical protein [Gillisia lutea]